MLHVALRPLPNVCMVESSGLLKTLDTKFYKGVHMVYIHTLGTN